MTLITFILLIAVTSFFISPFYIWIKADNKNERCWIITSDGKILPAIVRNYIGGNYYIVETVFNLCRVNKIYKTYKEARGG